MKFRTELDIKPSKSKISYKSKTALLGSCFSTEIGEKFFVGKMKVLVNPGGVIYNPESVADSLRIILERKEFTESDLHFSDNKYLSFYHDTGFSDSDKQVVLSRINESVSNAYNFLIDADFLFITFGTAWTYRWNKTGSIVSNCHKIPSQEFTRQLMKPGEIASSWQKLISEIKKLNNNIEIVFTVSPVRHLKDGAHGNQISKSTLHLAISDILQDSDRLSYFPSYELIMDDLRDYRFYNKDMVHPSAGAVDYIWEQFMNCYFDKATMNVYNSVSEVSMACNHRLVTDNKRDIERFAGSMMEKIGKIEKKYPFINFKDERDYFSNLL